MQNLESSTSTPKQQSKFQQIDYQVKTLVDYLKDKPKDIYQIWGLCDKIADQYKEELEEARKKTQHKETGVAAFIATLPKISFPTLDFTFEKDPTYEPNFTILRRIFMLQPLLLRMADGCKFITYIRNAKPLIEENERNGKEYCSYYWLLDNFEKLKELMYEDDFAEFFACCCEYQKCCNGTEFSELENEFKKFWKEEKHKMEEKKPISKPQSLQVSSPSQSIKLSRPFNSSSQSGEKLAQFSTYGSQYPARIQLCCSDIIKEMIKVQKEQGKGQDKLPEEFDQMLINLKEIVRVFRMSIQSFQVKFEDKDAKDLTLFYRGRIDAVKNPASGIFDPSPTFDSPKKIEPAKEWLADSLSTKEEDALATKENKKDWRKGMRMRKENPNGRATCVGLFDGSSNVLPTPPKPSLLNQEVTSVPVPASRGVGMWQGEKDPKPTPKLQASSPTTKNEDYRLQKNK